MKTGNASGLKGFIREEPIHYMTLPLLSRDKFKIIMEI
jgi:hypothetical protein